MPSRPLRRAPTTDALIKRLKGLLDRQMDQLEAHYDARDAERFAAAGAALLPPAPRPHYPRRRDS